LVGGFWRRRDRRRHFSDSRPQLAPVASASPCEISASKDIFDGLKDRAQNQAESQAKGRHRTGMQEKFESARYGLLDGKKLDKLDEVKQREGRRRRKCIGNLVAL
jgi:hypothetical protein